MKKFYIFLCVMVIILSAFSMANATPYTYSFSVNGGTATTIDPVSGTSSANAFYNFFSASGHPGFEQESTAFFWLYEDTDDGKLSLSVIFSKEDSNFTGAGSVTFNLSGLPSGWAWTLKDDDSSGDFPSDTSPDWDWNSQNTDGGVIGNLEGSSWSINWLLKVLSGIDDWYFLDGNTSTQHSFSLSVDDSLNVSSTPIPEPATILLLGFGLAWLRNVN